MSFLKKLAGEGVSQRLVDNAIGVWDGLKRFQPLLLAPTIGASEDGKVIGLTWGNGYGTDSFSVEVFDDEHVEWYYATSSDHWFYENLVTDAAPSQAAVYIERFYR